jgi:glycosyltransferase involved in cell wall biosynthesis
MRIAAQNAWPVFRGGEKALALLMAGLQRRGHEVLLVCANDEVAAGCAAYDVPTCVQRISGDARVDHALRFARVLQRFGADAALLGTFRKVLPAAAGARIARVPRVVCRVGTSHDTPRSRKYRFVLRHLVDAVVVNAAGMRPAFLAAAPRLDAARVVAIPTGVRRPVRTREPGALRRELGLPAGARVIGSLTWLAPLKRLDRVVRALALLPECVHWVHAGAGPEQSALETLADELGVRARVHFLGFRDDVGDVLDAFDLCVVTSEREGMSSSMLEALAAGVPVVSTPVSGAAEALAPLVDGEEPGRIVEPEAAAVAAAVRDVLDDAGLHARMRAAAARSARERFDYEHMLDAYEALLAGDGVRAPAQRRG